MESCLVIIPTYNEIENIHSVIDAVLAQGPQFSVLIVDDNSPDGTGEVVNILKQKESRIHLLQRAGKLGLGTAYIAGFRYGLSHGFDYIFEMDADFSHNPKDLPRLLEACVQGADMSIGSRYVKGGNIKNWSKDRLFLSYGASLYVKTITSLPVQDPTAGFICYHRRVLEALDLDKIKFVGYTFQIEMKYYAFIKGFKLAEVPITFVDREKGNSKMHANIVSEAIKGVLKMRWRRMNGYYA
ncbi:MAG TPA: polyprenol monophosphomannose synthase [Saprospiraceae bacterium]|nr:polyprenol monophosphomannose synthase [Saprospiraceae bacterium]MBK6665988.1 polyprenol monophosphomannose synthase [Saprospiraceae bacterium]MBK7699768.1 polyprenol monophosphomannose synthase [Saprospiraceae bacterium]MBK8828109.1 polyprenol monophosphomannose synthase [Saprospiraceae bacterium]MBK8886269.1 polyprenol monophosphomannose synthase [Saprospiraceae bacterium]